MEGNTKRKEIGKALMERRNGVEKMEKERNSWVENKRSMREGQREKEGKRRNQWSRVALVGGKANVSWIKSEENKG